ncbi:MAG: hypothetical protein CVV27_19400 [Candidatus Melainabacteria bacterium HGW-Melainabacteria-1]|nr:MAG: hypothetical protein CVV27_19400 [Candidatus Melainabacteria bacterium HGW-Melainabacteria-1]
MGLAAGLADAIRLAEDPLVGLELALAVVVFPGDDCEWDLTETWQADMAKARIKEVVTVRISDSFKKVCFQRAIIPVGRPCMAA